MSNASFLCQTQIKVLNLSQNVLLFSTVSVHFLFFYSTAGPKLGAQSDIIQGSMVSGTLTVDKDMDKINLSG